jgi:hypothetical protein
MVPGDEEHLSGQQESKPAENDLVKQPRTVPWKRTPPKGSEAIVGAVPPIVYRASGRSSLVGMLSVVLLALLAVVLHTSLAPQRSEELPDEILGTWTTTDPRYAETVLDIGRTTLVFGTVDNGSTSHTIERVDQEDFDLAKLYTVHYSDEGGLNELSFFYLPIDNVIRFKNQRSLAWRRHSVPAQDGT